METTLVEVLTVGGPVAAIAVLAIVINYKLVCIWADQNIRLLQDVSTALGEVNESLRRLNGKPHLGESEPPVG